MRLHDVSKLPGGSGGKVLSDDRLILLQNILLQMLDDLDRICRKNGIGFVLIGGTGIGAVRHSGFIPWDDDVDIAMKRSDYKRLLQIIRKEYSDKYEISDPGDRENHGKVIPKLRLKKTIYRTVFDAEDENHGIRLDIFVIENTFDNGLLRTIHGVGCYVFGFALSCRRLAAGWELYKELTDSFSLRVKAAAGVLFSFASLESWARWTDRWYSMCGNENSRYVALPSDDPHFYGTLAGREAFCSFTETEFEGRKLRIPAGIHEYLKRQYGDYMKLPPEEGRVRGRYLEFDPGIYEAVCGKSQSEECDDLC